jgi:hypothetical protein
MSLPVGIVLLGQILSKNGPPIEVSIKQIVLPILLPLVLTALAMGFYNLRVTGEILRLPYFVHEATYAVAPSFLWQRPRPEPSYRHEVVRDHHLGWELDSYMKQQSVRGLASEIFQKMKTLLKFYGGFGSMRLLLAVPLLMIPWLLRNRWQRFAVVICMVVVVGLAMETYFLPHYAAPVVGLVFMLGLQALRHVHIWRWRGEPVGRLLVWASWIVALAGFITAFPRRMPERTAPWALERGRIQEQLPKIGGRHLVIVRYGPLHESHHEWVYNQADIKSAPVVWAREMDLAENRKLLEYFKDRSAWLLKVDQDDFPPKLISYPTTSCP